MDLWIAGRNKNSHLFLCRHHPLNNLFVTLLVEIQFVANLVTSFPAKNRQNRKQKT